MRKGMIVPLAAVLLGVGASEVRADFGGARIYCVPGLPEGCFAADFAASDRGFTLLLQNLQGSFTSSPYRFDLQGLEVSLNAPGLVWSPPSDPWGEHPEGYDGVIPEVCGSGPIGAVIEGNDCYRVQATPYSVGEESPGVDRYVLEYISFNAFIQMGLLGCAGLESAPSEYVAVTCPRTGLDGWLAVSVNYGLYDLDTGDFVRAVTPSDVGILMRGQSNRPGSYFDGCYIGASGDGGCYEFLYDPGDFVGTPEPGTTALLGSGLAGLLGLGALKRRRR